MITSEQLDEISKNWKIDRFTVLREYLQVLFLKNLYGLKESEGVYFKGGTAIRLLFASYRFSEDLDFTAITDATKTKHILQGAQESSALEISGLGINSWVTKHNCVTARLKYATDIATQPLTIHLEMSLREKPITREISQIETIFPITPYPLIVHMNKEELLAEKVRALLTRQKGRDIFDIWFLLSKGVPLNNDMIQQKMDYYKRKYSFDDLKKNLKNFPLKNLKQDINKFIPVSHRQITEKLPQMVLDKL